MHATTRKPVILFSTHLGYMLFFTAFCPYFLHRNPSSRISSALLVWNANLGLLVFFNLPPFLFSLLSTCAPFSAIKEHEVDDEDIEEEHSTIVVLLVSPSKLFWPEKMLTQSILSCKPWLGSKGFCIMGEGGNDIGLVKRKGWDSWESCGGGINTGGGGGGFSGSWLSIWVSQGCELWEWRMKRRWECFGVEIYKGKERRSKVEEVGQQLAHKRVIDSNVYLDGSSTEVVEI